MLFIQFSLDTMCVEISAKQVFMQHNCRWAYKPIWAMSTLNLCLHMCWSGLVDEVCKCAAKLITAVWFQLGLTQCYDYRMLLHCQRHLSPINCLISGVQHSHLACSKQIAATPLQLESD